MKTHIKDPSSEEMIAFLLSRPCRSDDDRDDAIVAIYYFASEWHGGQWTNLYSALSTSEFSPGPMGRRETESETVREMICDLEEEFAGRDYGQNPCGLDLTRGPVWMLWHGGSSYAVADQMRREDCEEFATLADALSDFESRPDDGFYPCVTRDLPDAGGPSAWICYSDPFENGDVYPDCTLQFNERGNATVTNG